MAVELQYWSDGYARHAQAMNAAISGLCADAREVRTSAVRLSRPDSTGSSIQTLSEHFQDLRQILKSELCDLAGGRVDQVVSGLPGNTSTALNSLLELSARLTSDINLIVESEPHFKTATDPNASKINQNGILQQGARHFTKISEVFQLQDRFDQRHEHITAGFAAASNASGDAAYTMFKVVNGQVLGMANRTLEYLELADLAALALHSMEAVSSEDRRATQHALVAARAKLLPKLGEVTALSDAIKEAGMGGISSYESDRVGSVDVPEPDEKSGITSLIYEYIASLSLNCKMIIESRCGEIDSDYSRKSRNLKDNLVKFESKSLELGDSASQMKSFALEQESIDGSITKRNAKVSKFLDQISGSYTMDDEREDHRFSVYNLGLG